MATELREGALKPGDPGYDEIRSWACTGEVYLNFTGRADEAPSEGVDSALGRNLARLAEVKAMYDPDNFFRVNDNIAPA